MKKIIVENVFFPNILDKNSKGIIIKYNSGLIKNQIIKLIPRDLFYENVIVEIDSVTHKKVYELTDYDLKLICEENIYNLLVTLNGYLPVINEESTITIAKWNTDTMKIDSSFFSE